MGGIWGSKPLQYGSSPTCPPLPPAAALGVPPQPIWHRQQLGKCVCGGVQLVVGPGGGQEQWQLATVVGPGDGWEWWWLAAGRSISGWQTAHPPGCPAGVPASSSLAAVVGPSTAPWLRTRRPVLTRNVQWAAGLVGWPGKGQAAHLHLREGGSKVDAKWCICSPSP